MAVLGIGREPIGFVAPWRFKTFDSQPEKSNMGPISNGFHDLGDCQKCCRGFDDFVDMVVWGSRRVPLTS